MIPGNYKMYFGEDTNYDNEFDSKDTTTYANFTVPCDNDKIPTSGQQDMTN